MESRAASKKSTSSSPSSRSGHDRLPEACRAEQQMCAVARALMAAPKLLMVDEMSLGLAPVVVDQLLAALTEIRHRGVTILLVEQDVFAAFSIADRGYVLETGRITREGDVKDLANDPEVRRAYLGANTESTGAV